jgi:quercetin dioxygenase-like cupin family protein
LELDKRSIMTRVWCRPTDGPALGPQQVIHIGEAKPATFTSPDGAKQIGLTPLTSDDCGLCVVVFSLPPNYRGSMHSHPTDTVYIIRRGQFLVEGEGTYEVGDIRWVKAGTPYGPEGAGPDGCEVLLIGAGTFPLPINQHSA